MKVSELAYQRLSLEEFAAEMEKIENCIGCRACARRCPYQLDTPALLKASLADYRAFRKEFLANQP